MTIACIANTVHFYGLTNHLNEQRKKNEFCDVILKVAGRTLPTHACVLSAVSPFFRGLIHEQRLPIPQEIDLSIPDVDGEDEQDKGTEEGLRVIECLLDYIYTGQIVLQQGTINLVVKLAETFMLDGLLGLVKRYLKSRVTDPKHDTVGELAVKQGALVPTRKVVTLPIRRKNLAPAFRVKRPTDTARQPVRTAPTAPAGKTRAKNTAKKYWFSCSQCRFFSCDLRAVRDHKLLHPGSNYVCITCGFFTGQCGRLLDHLLASDHVETRCSLCPFETDDPTAFREHLKTDHDPGKPHYCRHCEFKCRSRSHLSAHEKKHGAARPFVCDVCPASFKWKKTLQRHQFCHTKEKPFICDKCDFRTAYKKTLVIHLRRHRGEMIPCPREKCKCVCYDQRHLEKHLLTHTNLKHYICEACGEKFAQEHSLKRHLKIHDREANNLNCAHCPYVTTRNDKLREHMRKSHNLELALVRNLYRPVPTPEKTPKPTSTVAFPSVRPDDNSDMGGSASYQDDSGHDQHRINFTRQIEDEHREMCGFNRQFSSPAAAEVLKMEGGDRGEPSHAGYDHKHAFPSTSQSFRSPTNSSEMMFVAASLSLGLMDFSRH